MKAEFEGAAVTITGGTGSFGSTMLRALLGRGVGQINVLSRDESKQEALRQELADPRVQFFLGDVRDYQSVANAVSGSQYVFHAAALKQVPSCEFFPDQAVKTNVMGSANVVEACSKAGVQSVVCLSTDKAVYPVNAMGMSKALMEKGAQAFARNNPDSSTVVSITRYGNVMCSRGSVIPLFVNQIQASGEVTVTEPSMTRFIMSLQESVDLVEHAFVNARSGDLFVKKAPACTVETLALAVAQVIGAPKPRMRRIGIRHGEKMYETLLSREELIKADDQGDYFRVPLDTRSLDYGLYVDEGDKGVVDVRDYDSHSITLLTVDETAQRLLELPEFSQYAGATS